MAGRKLPSYGEPGSGTLGVENTQHGSEEFQMGRTSWVSVALIIALLAIVRYGRGDDPPAADKQRKLIPYIRVGGILDTWRGAGPGGPGKDMFYLDCFTPGNNGGEMMLGVKTGKASILLHVDAAGRMSPISLDELLRNRTAAVRAVVSRDMDSSMNHLRLVYWLIQYSDPKMAPPMLQASPDTDFSEGAVVPEL
jgi:hypothetical protein